LQKAHTSSTFAGVNAHWSVLVLSRAVISDECSQSLRAGWLSLIVSGLVACGLAATACSTATEQANVVRETVTATVCTAMVPFTASMPAWPSLRSVDTLGSIGMTSR
jgi:hypothetical protein